MSWWGKLAGGALGFMMGGPIGALVGAAVGHTVDRGLASFGDETIADSGFDRQNRAQAAFFTAAFSVMGHVAKADGRVTPDEIQLATRFMDHIGLDENMKSAAKLLFRQGREPDFDLLGVLEQFRRECHHSRNLRRMFLEIQLQAAYADRRIHPGESAVLGQIVTSLHLTREEFDNLDLLVRTSLGLGPDGAGRALADDYALLELTPQASPADVKRAYRRLMSRHHPDKLIAQGMPEEMVKVATERTQSIKAAYERIRAAER